MNHHHRGVPKRAKGLESCELAPLGSVVQRRLRDERDRFLELLSEDAGSDVGRSQRPRSQTKSCGAIG